MKKIVIGLVLSLLGLLLVGCDELSPIPVIKLNGEATVYVEYDGTYTESGATCTIGDDETCNVVIGGATVDPTILGTYIITYNGEDIDGNKAQEKTRTVIVRDTINPEFDSVPQTQTISKGTVLDLSNLGLTALDNYDGDITSLITVSIENTSILDVGSYSVVYTVQDTSGNTSNVSITLIVEELIIGLGDTIIFDDLEIYFKSTKVEEVDNMFSNYEKAVLIEVEIRNFSNEVHSLNMFYHTGFGPDGLEVNSIGAYFDSAIDFLGEMLPNAVMTGHLVYEYNEDGVYTIEFSKFLEKDITVKLDVVQIQVIEATNSSGFDPYAPNVDFISSTFEMGDIIVFDGLEIFFKSSHVETVDNMFSDYEKAVLIEVEIRNISNEVHSLNMFYHTGFGSDGLEVNSIGAYFDSAIDFLGEMLPNAVMTGHLVYEYNEDGVYTIEFSKFLGDALYVEIEVDQLMYLETSNSSNFTPYTLDLDFENNFINTSETFVFDELEITVFTSSVQLVDNMFSDYEKAVLIEITVKNISDESHSLNMFYHTGFGPDGLEVNSIGAYFDSAIDYLGEMLPNAVMTGHLVYEYTGDGVYVISFDRYSEQALFVGVQVSE